MIPRNRSDKILHKRPGGRGASASLATRCVGEVIRSVGASRRQSLWLSSLRVVAADLFERARDSCDEGETSGVLVRYGQVGVAAPQEEW
jgi:hypothetical protein